MRRVTILILMIGLVNAQVFDFQGWAQNSSISGAVSGFYDMATPTNQKPVGNFWPQVGPLNSFIDPVGTRSFIFADEFGNFGYSTRTLVSANNTYGIVFSNSGPKVYNMKTGALVCTVSVSGISSASNNINWSGVRDTRLMYIGGNTVRVLDVTVCPASWTVLATFDGTNGRPLLTNLTNGGTSDGSADDHFPFITNDQDMLCVIDIETSGAPHTCISFADLTEVVNAGPDNPFISKGPSSLTGRRYVFVQSGTNSGQAQWHYTTIAGGLTFSHQWESLWATGTGDKDGIWEPGEAVTGGSHSDTGQTADGRQYVLKGECDVGSTRYRCLVWVDLETAATQPANVLWLRQASFNGSGSKRWPQTNHVGCAKKVDVCVVSGWSHWYTGGDMTVSNNYVQHRPVATTGSSPYQAHTPLNFATEAIYDHGARYRIVTHARGQMWDNFTGGSTSGDSYNNMLRTNISADGTWVAYATQFGSSPTTDLRVVFAHIGSDPGKALRVTNKTATTATLRYVAPSVTACTVTVDDSSGFGSPVSGFSAVSDTPDGRNDRSMALTGLTTGTLYYVRVTCGGKNADATFQTR